MDRPRSEQLADIDYEEMFQVGISDEMRGIKPEEKKLGHYLQTSNPKAAAEIDNPPSPPDVSTWVVFLPRAGVTRMHRSEFPALVLGHYDDGTLSLMVVMEAEDMISEERVPFQSHNQSAFCWRHRRAGPVEADLEPRIREIEDFLREEGNDDVVAMDSKLLAVLEGIGKRVETIESVLASDEMEALEKRIAALEGKKPGRKPKAK